MLIKIAHHTHYHYSQPVYLEPFTVRLRPRSDATQTLRSYSTNVSPQPNGINHCIELDGNNTETIWFSGLHDNLLIKIEMLIQTHHGNPFNFLITDPNALKLPLKYEPNLMPALASYLARNNNAAEVTAFTQKVLRKAGHETVLFLSLLAEEIYSSLKYMFREHGDPWTPEETIEQGRGSCRDFAILFIDICRSVGIAARFVSGYCIGEEAASRNDMHAWAEVYLPGAGWRGFDPSRGLLVSDDYISVAAGRKSQDAAPTSGSFRGVAKSTLLADISITVIENENSAQA